MIRIPLIRRAAPADIPTLLTMLHALVAEDQGTVASTTETLSQAVFGPVPLIHGLIAPDGMALCYPDYSTHCGEPGLYIQDLYVSPTARGTGLARALVAATLQHQTWGAHYINRSTVRRRALSKSPSPRNHSSRRPQPEAQAGAQARARVAACACKPAPPHPSDTSEPLSHCLNHVWMAPAKQGLFGLLASGRLRPCIRRRRCGMSAARPDEFRVDLVPINGPRFDALRFERGVHFLLSVSLPSSRRAGGAPVSCRRRASVVPEARQCRDAPYQLAWPRRAKCRFSLAWPGSSRRS